jgi:hypothetical protein
MKKNTLLTIAFLILGLSIKTEDTPTGDWPDVTFENSSDDAFANLLTLNDTIFYQKPAADHLGAYATSGGYTSNLKLSHLPDYYNEDENGDLNVTIEITELKNGYAYAKCKSLYYRIITYDTNGNTIGSDSIDTSDIIDLNYIKFSKGTDNNKINAGKVMSAITSDWDQNGLFDVALSFLPLGNTLTGTYDNKTVDDFNDGRASAIGGVTRSNTDSDEANSKTVDTEITFDLFVLLQGVSVDATEYRTGPELPLVNPVAEGSAINENLPLINTDSKITYIPYLSVAKDITDPNNPIEYAWSGEFSYVPNNLIYVGYYLDSYGAKHYVGASLSDLDDTLNFIATASVTTDGTTRLDNQAADIYFQNIQTALAAAG